MSKATSMYCPSKTVVTTLGTYVYEVDECFKTLFCLSWRVENRQIRAEYVIWTTLIFLPSNRLVTINTLTAFPAGVALA